MPRGHRGVGSYLGAAGSYATGGKFTLMSQQLLKSANSWDPVLPARYFIFKMVAIRGGGGDTLVQLSEFNLMNSATRITSATYNSWNLSFSPAGVGDASTYPSGENPTLANDGNTGTKWLDFRGAGGGLLIDLGTAQTTTGYQWYTANDGSWRDPASWEVWCSNNLSSWTKVSTVSGFSATTSRNTFAGSWNWST